MFHLVLVAVILCLIFKALNVNSSPAKSVFYSSSAKLVEQVLAHAPSLAEPYAPTKLWGFSGHLQTVVQGLFGRLHSPLVNGKRFVVQQPDGATLTYDLYQAIEKHALPGKPKKVAMLAHMPF